MPVPYTATAYPIAAAPNGDQLTAELLAGGYVGTVYYDIIAASVIFLTPNAPAPADITAVQALVTAHSPVANPFKTGNYTIVPGDAGKPIIWTSGTATATISAGATYGIQFVTVLANMGSGTITVSPAETIMNVDGTTSASITLTKGQSTSLFWNGTNWLTIGGSKAAGSGGSIFVGTPSDQSASTVSATINTYTPGSQVVVRVSGFMTVAAAGIGGLSMKVNWTDPNNTTTNLIVITTNSTGIFNFSTPVVINVKSGTTATVTTTIAAGSTYDAAARFENIT